MNRVGSPFDTRMEHDFRIALRDKLRTVVEFAPQIAKIVDLTVEDKRESLGAVEHGLVAQHRRILNGQTNRTQADGDVRTSVAPGPAIIGTSMPHSVAATMQSSFLNRLCVERNDTANTAHVADYEPSCCAVSVGKARRFANSSTTQVSAGSA